ncbi:MAG: nucleotide-binding protein [Euryarchaeota archaeon]|nr:nucleotide-binding protein [Euryarchaeota archaeon]MCG2738513.1 PIN domain-containing protein [Candidatus Methanoperedenaceae archaeon]
MRLVLDANRLFAALIKDSIARKILFHPSLEFIAPDYILIELSNHKKELLRKSKLPEDEFDILFQSLFENIIIIPLEEIKPCYKRAMEIMKNIDPDDAVFLAISICSPNDGIWTEDAHFEKQDVVRVWKTTELMDELGMEKG